MKKSIIYLLCITTVFAFGIIDYQDSEYKKNVQEYCKVDSCKCYLSNGIRFAKFNNKNGNLNYFVFSDDIIKVKGYRGITSLGILFGENSKIISIKIIKSEDTPSFIRMIKRKWFLEQFTNWDGESNLKSVTGATVSSKALIETVRKVREKMKTNISQFR